ncbi:MAG: response regulator [Coriobacteriaceae bacterium]|nr:response regulator [Coriobacteriaceae bacterium]
MQTANKRYLIIAVNVAVMLAIIGFVLLYAQRAANESIDAEVAQFETATVTMEQVTANYLESEQIICNTWARYINNNAMTVDEAVAFIRASHASPDTAAHIVFTDDDSLAGLSTRPKTGTKNDYAVSYKAIGLPIQLDNLNEQDGAINVSRSYTNPSSGIQSLAFCNKVTLVDSRDATKKREAVLLRIIPTEKLQDKWVFPIDRYKDAEVSLVDSDGNYIIKGHHYKNNNFIEFYKSYNEVDFAGVEDLKTRLNTQSGSFFMANSRAEECLIAYAPISANEGWTILNYIQAGNLHRSTVDWLLVGGVACALLFLLFFDMLFMNWFNVRLNEAAKEAEAANRAKSDFLSTMSHDIRTPMNAILGLTTIAERNVDDPATVKDSLHKIGLASNHLLTLINDILDISKVESGKLSLTPVMFSIVEVTENLVNISQPMVKEKNIDFDFHINAMEHEFLYADQLRINQVFINILSNALKYTEAGGSVKVDLKELPSDLPGAVRLVYRVADTGMGMSEEFMEHMYESFSRQTDSRVNSVQGTGLGLAITKQMVDLMGGTIDCESKLGEGTTFTVALDVPIADQEAQDMTLESVDALLVDDDEVLLQTAQDTLSSLDARVEVASSGAQALEMVGARHSQHNDYSVIIVDWKMPGMDGIEVMRRVRALTGGEVPIILISAYDWSEIEESAKAAGADGFISKPLFRTTLYRAINELLHLADTPAAREDDNSDIAGMRVLVAEDNDINWEIINTLLDTHGIQATRAENGQVAVDAVASAQPGDFDLVFMDVQMPVMNGIEAAKAIRALPDEAASTIPIIATTADAFSEDVARCMDAGMNGHIAKPIDMKLVLKEIRRVKEGKL